jgi:hypothetical protein
MMRSRLLASPSSASSALFKCFNKNLSLASQTSGRFDGICFKESVLGSISWHGDSWVALSVCFDSGLVSHRSHAPLLLDFESPSF